MSREDPGSPTNPMLYDPVPDYGVMPTRKTTQFLAATIISLGAVSAGTALAWTSPVLPQLQQVSNETLSITEDEGSWVGSFLAIGAFVGALPAGCLAEKIGRKYSTIALAIPFVISWGLIVFAANAGMLYAGRFFAGVATGGYCVVCPMYISEIADVSIRGTLGSFFQLFLTIGILLVYAVGAAVGWRLLSIICAIMPVLLIVCMLLVPDTPTFFLKQGKRNEAASSLKWLWGPQSNTQRALQAIQTDLDSSRGSASVGAIFTNRSNLVALIISLSLMFFQQFSGINAVIFYTNPIFKSAGSSMDPEICSIVVGVVQVLMTFISAVLIEKAGRRILLLQSSIVMGLCLATLGVYFNMKDRGVDVSNIGLLPLLSVVFFIVSFSLGFGPIPWMMMGELFAPDVKGIASAIAVMFNWALVFLITKTFSSMIVYIGSDLTFWFFASCMALCTIFVAIKVPETKGKSNAEIQLILSEIGGQDNKLNQKYIPMNREL